MGSSLSHTRTTNQHQCERTACTYNALRAEHHLFFVSFFIACRTCKYIGRQTRAPTLCLCLLFCFRFVYLSYCQVCLVARYCRTLIPRDSTINEVRIGLTSMFTRLTRHEYWARIHREGGIHCSRAFKTRRRFSADLGRKRVLSSGNNYKRRYSPQFFAKKFLQKKKMSQFCYPLNWGTQKSRLFAKR